MSKRRHSCLNGFVTGKQSERPFGRGTSLSRARKRSRQNQTLSSGLYHYYQKRFEELGGHELPETWAPMIALDEK
jgi:hypothetical protein